MVVDKTQEEFIQQAKEIHGDKYDYSKVEYKNTNEKVIIVCPKHGEFNIRAGHHIYHEQGCKECKKLEKEPLSFVSKSKEIHGDKYDYSKVEYVNGNENVIIICPKHGEFLIKPNYHKLGTNCPSCHIVKYDQQTFLDKANEIYGDKYDYSKVNYVNMSKIITIICSIHGAFKTTARKHITCKQGCYECKKNEILQKNIVENYKEFIEKANKKYNNKYNYSKVVYDHSDKKVIIICPKHGDFEQTPQNHLSKSIRDACKKCLPKRKVNINEEEFIKLAKDKYGDRYDYSKTKYVNKITKIIIICKKHKYDFLQGPHNHLQGKQGCCICRNKVVDTNSFIIKAKEIHGDKYDYSKVIYNNSDKKVTIICPEHGEFEQTPANHTHSSNKRGCPKCGLITRANKRKLTTEEFIKRAKEIHGDKYDYSKVGYINSTKKVIIICPKHGEYYMAPSNIIYQHNGQGCPKCSGFHRTTEEFIHRAKEIHGDKYDYSKVEYTGCNNKVTIICKKHGYFKQLPNGHFNSYGCIDCANEQNGINQRFSNEEFIEKAKEIHGDKYDYSKTNYIKSIINIEIICKKHGSFYTKPNYHLSHKRGCPKCLLCPSCELWRTNGDLCRYCNSESKEGKILREKTKEMEVVRFLSKNLPDYPFYHNKSVGSDCTKNDREHTNGHLYPDIRFDCDTFQLIVEIDEFRHRGADYKCDERRMYDIIAKLGMRCVFIRYNPDSQETNKHILLETTKKYLKSKKIKFDDFGLKTEYLFYR